MKTGDKIKACRKARGLTQDDLAKLAGFSSRSTISKIESNQRNINQAQIAKIASVLKIDPASLIETDFDEKPVNARPLPQVYACKYYHSVSAGIGTNAGEDSDTYSYFFHSQSQADHCFAVDIEGDSMTPELHDGDIAIVDTEAEPQSGDIVVFYDKADDLGYIKQYHRSDDVVMFISFNTAYKPITYPLSALGDRVKIWGKVVRSLREF